MKKLKNELFKKELFEKVIQIKRNVAIQKLKFEIFNYFEDCVFKYNYIQIEIIFGKEKNDTFILSLRPNPRGTVPLNNCLEMLTNKLLHKFEKKIKIDKLQYGYCKKDPNIKILTLVSFKIIIFDDIINEIKDLSNKNNGLQKMN